MAHQEASRSKYIIAFIVANFASNMAAKLGDLVFSESDYFNSAIRTGELEQAWFANSAISSVLAAATWIAVFLMFKNIYFQRMLWYVIAGQVIIVLVGFSISSQTQDLLGLTDTFLLQSARLSFAIAMTVPLFFYVLREDRYYPPAIPKRNQERSSRNSQTEAYPEADTVDSLDEPQSVDNPDADDEELYEIALNELDNNTQIGSTYAKALALSEGDIEKARWTYIDLRVANLKIYDESSEGAKEASKTKLSPCVVCGIYEPTETLSDGVCLECI